MAEPVLVVHGVANRNQRDFERLVGTLQDNVGKQYDLIPVYWGDLAAATAGIRDTIPSLSDGAANRDLRPFGPEVHASLLRKAGGSKDIPNQAGIIARAAARAITGSRNLAASESATPDPAGLEARIRAELPETTYLKYIASEPVLAAVGETIGTGIKRSREMAPDIGPARGFGDIVGGLLHSADKLTGAILGEAFGTVNHFLRNALIPNIAEAIGDVFVYEHKRLEIQDRLWKAIDDHPSARGRGTDGRPIHVVAHSLGGVIAFQAATSEADRKLWIDGLVTFGSQSPFFHVLDPTGSAIAPYRSGSPVEIRATIRSWTNLWEPLDPLAFIAKKVFKLSTPDRLRDVPTEHLASTGLWTHSSYWSSSELIQEIHNTLAGVPVAGGLTTKFEEGGRNE